jgi:hypothetical protein
MIARTATTPTVAPAITPALDLWGDEEAESGEVDVDGDVDGLPEALELVGLSSTLRGVREIDTRNEDGVHIGEIIQQHQHRSLHSWPTVQICDQSMLAIGNRGVYID